MSAPSPARRGEHAVADRVGADDDHRADRVRCVRDLGQGGLHGSGPARGLHPDGGDGVVEPGADRGEVGHRVLRGYVDQVQVGADEVADAGTPVRQHVAGDQHGAPPGYPSGHRQRGGRGLVAVVGGHGDHVHRQQFGHQRLVLEQAWNRPWSS